MDILFKKKRKSPISVINKNRYITGDLCMWHLLHISEAGEYLTCGSPLGPPPPIKFYLFIFKFDPDKGSKNICADYKTMLVILGSKLIDLIQVTLVTR